jgi:hypothetical protein
VNWLTLRGPPVEAELSRPKRLIGMPDQSERENCILCKRGRVIERRQEIAFRQWTNKGYVYCRVTIPMRICTLCGLKTSDGRAEATLDEAVRQEYDKLG